MRRTRIFVAFLVLLGLGGGARSAPAQMVGHPVPGKPYRLMDMDAGLGTSFHLTGLFQTEQSGLRLTFLTPPGLDGRIYLHRADGRPGWAYLLADRGWNAFAGDLPGFGRSLPPASRDIQSLANACVESTMRLSAATFARAVVAQGIHCAFVIKVRSTVPDQLSAAILIDPIGPPGVQDFVDLSPEEVYERRQRLDEIRWVEWGFGPRPGVRYPDLDLSQAECESLLTRMHRDDPPLWTLALTHLKSYLEVPDASQLAGWPVLVVRSARATEEMDARREAVTSWLEANGALVERLDLAEEGPEGLSNLPMLGTGAPEALDLFFEWVDNLPDHPKLGPSR